MHSLKKFDQQLIGTIALQLTEDCKEAELGYWIDEVEWGQGYCTEADKELVAFGFGKLNLKKINSHHFAKNPASGRVLQKIGMQQVAYHERYFEKWGEWQDMVFYEISKPASQK